MSTQSKLSAAILVISETAAREPPTDKCIPALKEVLEKDGNDQWHIAETKIVKDDVLDIQRAVAQWTDNHSNINLIVTSGGTGFAVKDVTPEVDAIMSLQCSAFTDQRKGDQSPHPSSCAWPCVCNDYYTTGAQSRD